ncbi:FHA domain-containing protein [Nesterenkonia sp. NBAIMH1]|uniref:FHA domain-containing protein n=1 Tax=Nesterenkonia sp. NBAIMH1 TaxID=2600320 RepID=UPI0011B6CF4C|nr:FHA domain-containing protein [Nesterenkonia sp. NBAIMH1]
MVRLDIDMTFSWSEPETNGRTPAPLEGSITASGKHITVTLTSEGPVLQRSRALTEAVRTLAEGLAGQGMTLSLVVPQGKVLTIGDVSARLPQRILSRSKWVRYESLRTLSRMTKPSADDDSAGAAFLPPPTPWPLVPTVNRRIRRRVTTTHSAPGSGRPRLRLVKNHPELGPGPLMEFNLEKGRTLIGSADHCDLQLSDISAEHAEIIHDERDEYIVVSRGVTTGSVNADSTDRVVLRTGSRLQIGPWRIIFFREEYADHGRPFGGRQGGEFSYQRPQYDPYRQRVE